MPAAVPSKTVPSVYLDTCCYQRPVEATMNGAEARVVAEAADVAALLALCRVGNVDRLVSPIVWYEAELNPDSKVRTQVLGQVGGACREVAFDRAAAARAAALGRTRRAKVRDCDEMHLACAVGAGATVLCTVDDGLLRRGRRTNTGTTRVLTPTDALTFLTTVS